MHVQCLVRGVSVFWPMSEKNRRLVADEPVEFATLPVEVQEDFRKCTDHFIGMYRRMYLK